MIFILTLLFVLTLYNFLYLVTLRYQVHTKVNYTVILDKLVLVVSSNFIKNIELHIINVWITNYWELNKLIYLVYTIKYIMIRFLQS